MKLVHFVRKIHGLGQLVQGYQKDPCQNSKLPDYHYLNVSLTPVQIDGLSRKIDDFQPRRMLHQMYKENKISLADESSIDEFCKKFVIEKEIIERSIEHIQLLDIKKKKRLEERRMEVQQEESKQYGEIDWELMCNKNILAKLRVKTLNKYLEYHKMEKYTKLKKKEKIKVISHHVAFKTLKLTVQDEINDSDSSDSDDQEDSDDDDVVDFVGDDDYNSDKDDNKTDGTSDSNMGDETDNSQEFNVNKLFVTTRSGRSNQS